MSELIHVSIDDILTNWQSGCTYKDGDGDMIDECSIGRIAPWGAHYIAVIHDDVPEDERQELAKFIANAPDRIEKLQDRNVELVQTLLQLGEDHKSQDIHITSQSNEIDRWQELQAKEFNKNQELEAALEEAKFLLAAADCPQCGDKTGAYYANDGEMCQCQCQWCYEVSKLNES